jgi:phosphatidylglycerol:prolipoprotein diacylglycerol transferase
MDPAIFTLRLGEFTLSLLRFGPVMLTIRAGAFAFSLHWYGVLAVAGILVGEWVAERQLRRWGGDPDYLWEGLTWAIPAGIIGSRLWYVANDILGGGGYYLEDPGRILRVWEGGLHWYGGMLFAGLAFWLYARSRRLDIRLILDAVAPSLLIGQGIARLGNYINQELYGPPTSLPWGIPIDPQHRIAPWNDLSRFPAATTRFHPAFAYEMVWNFACAGLLLWLARRYEKRLKPTSLFAGWLVLAGVGRVWLESFRPDQPVIPGTGLSYTRIVAALMAVAGTLLLLIRYRVIRAPFVRLGPDAYALPPAPVEAAEQAEAQVEDGDKEPPGRDLDGESERGDASPEEPDTEA